MPTPAAPAAATLEANLVLPGPGDYTLRWSGPDGVAHAISIEVQGQPAPATESSPTPTPTPTPVAQPRSGVRTTEFWLTAATTATPVLAISKDTRVAALAAVASAAVGIVYTLSRSRTKIEALKAGGTMTSAEVVDVVQDAGSAYTRLRVLRLLGKR